MKKLLTSALSSSCKHFKSSIKSIQRTRSQLRSQPPAKVRLMLNDLYVLRPMHFTQIRSVVPKRTWDECNSDSYVLAVFMLASPSVFSASRKEPKYPLPTLVSATCYLPANPPSNINAMEKISSKIQKESASLE